MAVFNKNSLSQISGFNNQILSGELVYQQKAFWNIQLENAGVVIPLTGATIDAQIIRRVLTNVMDTRNGLTFDISDYTPTPTPISLTIANRSDSTGFFTLIMDESAWGTMATDPDLEINNVNGAGYSGRIKIEFPASGATPAMDIVIFLFFIVRSDGIVVE